MAFSFVHEYDDQTFGGACCSCSAPRRNGIGERLVDLGPLVDVVQDLDGNIFGFKKLIMCETCINELTTMVGGTPRDRIERDNVEHWKHRALTAEKDAARVHSILERMQKITA